MQAVWKAMKSSKGTKKERKSVKTKEKTGGNKQAKKTNTSSSRTTIVSAQPRSPRVTETADESLLSGPPPGFLTPPMVDLGNNKLFRDVHFPAAMPLKSLLDLNGLDTLFPPLGSVADMQQKMESPWGGPAPVLEAPPVPVQFLDDTPDLDFLPPGFVPAFANLNLNANHDGSELFTAMQPPEASLLQQSKVPVNAEIWSQFVKMMRGPGGQEGGTTSGGEFQIHSEDFPALPGATVSPPKVAPAHATLGNGLANNQLRGGCKGEQNEGRPLLLNSVDEEVEPNSAAESISVVSDSDVFEREAIGIQTHPDGRVTNIPASMLADQFGMAGLLTYLRAIDDPAIVALPLGHDLTTLGINLGMTEYKLYKTFGGPFASVPCRMQDVDAQVPDEYLTNTVIRTKLPNIKLNRLGDDVLFFLFYNYPGEIYQVAAACELHARDWRFHKEQGVWLTRSVLGGVMEQTGSFERGTYDVFDPDLWRKVPKEMELEYEKLEERPKLPTAMQNMPQTQLGGAGLLNPKLASKAPAP